jgi:hypothetical protein
LLSLCWLPQSAFSELHPPHLIGHYNGIINSKLPIHVYFFSTIKDLDGVLNGFYRYGNARMPASLLHLLVLAKAVRATPPSAKLPRKLITRSPR